MKKQLFIFLCLGLSISTAYGMSEHAQGIIKILEAQGTEIKSGNITSDGTSITYTGLFGDNSEAGITCTKKYTSNEAICSTFERSDEGLSNFEQMSAEDSNAWFEIFNDYFAVPQR